MSLNWKRLSGLLLLIPFFVRAQESLKLGAYYFDGWTGKTPHVTQKLKTEFSERQPIWGWQTSTAEIITKQIDVAEEAGLSFFSFCWYYNPRTKGTRVASDPKNNALNLFRKLSKGRKLKYNIMVANHSGYEIIADEWPALCKYWISLFKDSSYLTTGQKPVIIFYDIPSLVSSFGSPDLVAQAFTFFNDEVKKSGFSGIALTANVGADTDVAEIALLCGFNVLTGYNYHNNGLATVGKKRLAPIDSMRSAETRVWNTITNQTGKPIIPVVTLNWDKRPWDKSSKSQSPYFVGYSGESVRKAVETCKEWVFRNHDKVLPENLAIVYAWNEYGEGAWLTPSRKLNNQLLEGLRQGLR